MNTIKYSRSDADTWPDTFVPQLCGSDRTPFLSITCHHVSTTFQYSTQRGTYGECVLECGARLRERVLYRGIGVVDRREHESINSRADLVLARTATVRRVLARGPVEFGADGRAEL